MELLQVASWNTMCEVTGFCDVYYKNKKSAPEWMNEVEKVHWAIGAARAELLL